nr:restriction endonuclease subunit S [Acinetobacter sp. YH12025]
MTSPKLRFKEFEGNWSKKRLDSFLERISNPVNVVGTQNYIQIGIRSHGKGIFHKESVTGKELGNKRVFWVVPNALVVNIVFAWERAIAVTSDKENGLIASHRFPMYAPKDGLSDVNFLRYMFITDKGQSYLEFASPGGAGRNKTLGQSNFAELKIDLPTAEEQTKIASFLSVVDERIGQLSQKHELLSQYKQGMMQKLFSQQIRFKADDGSEFGEWNKKAISEIASYRRGSFPQPYGLPEWLDENGFPFVQVYDVAENMLLKDKTKIKISQLAANQSVLAKEGTLIITLQGSIGRVAKMQYDAYVDRTLLIFQNYKMPINTDYFKYALYLLFNVEKEKADGGIIKTITKETLSKFEVGVPCLEEQAKIAHFLSAIDQKIEVVAQQIEQAKQWKKGLLQQMFV